jgi:hypothetical protein
VSDFACRVALIEDEILDHLARDPAPERRIEAICLALMSWRDGGAHRRAEVESRMLAIAGGLDYFARLELVDVLGASPDVPARLLGLLGEDTAPHGALVPGRARPAPSAQCTALPADGACEEPASGQNREGMAWRRIVDEVAERLAGRSQYRVADIRGILELADVDELGMLIAARKALQCACSAVRSAGR